MYNQVCRNNQETVLTVEFLKMLTKQMIFELVQNKTKQLQ
jgi:hypothetical protein